MRACVLQVLISVRGMEYLAHKLSMYNHGMWKVCVQNRVAQNIDLLKNIPDTPGRDVRMLVSRNGGASWSNTPITDPTGEDASPARFIVGEIAGSSAGDLWAVGGRRSGRR